MRTTIITITEGAGGRAKVAVESVLGKGDSTTTLSSAVDVQLRETDPLRRVAEAVGRAAAASIAWRAALTGMPL